MGNEKAVLFISWNKPMMGKETEAMKHMMEVGGWLDSQQKMGFFGRWDGYWLTPHGSNTNGAFQCFGDRVKLDEWRRTDEFEAFVFRMGACMEGMCVVPGVSYAAASETMARRAKAIGNK